MTMTANGGTYSYGTWGIGEQQCPIGSAGLDDEVVADEVATDFDDEVHGMLGTRGGSGVISAEDARKAFKRLQKRYKRTLQSACSRRDLNRKKLELTEQVLETELDI